MLNLYLVRHGETKWNKKRLIQGQTNTLLSAVGKKQAKLIAKYFADFSVSAIYSSDLLRASLTAEIIANQHHMDIILHKGLREIWLGDWQGLTWEEIEKKFPEQRKQWFAREDLAASNGESLKEASERAWLALEDICKSHEEGNVLVVSHGLVIGTILCQLNNKPLLDWHTYSLANTAFHKLLYVNNKWQLELFNQKFHLNN